MFIPRGEPPCNGSTENFKGWFQPRLFERRLARPGDRRRAWAVLEETVNTLHVHPRRGGWTPAQHRRRQRLRKLPQRYLIPTEALPRAAGRGTFLRRVSLQGTVSVLSQSFGVGKRPRGLHVQVILDTERGRRTAYRNGRVLKRWPYTLLNE